MSDQRKKYIKIFIVTLVILQGLYVIIPLPDIWPIANYSMFSRSKVKTVASRMEIRGVKEDGNEVTLSVSEDFYPLDSIRLSRGINRILDSEKYRAKNEKRIEQVVKFLGFLPFDKAQLREMISNNLVYESKFDNEEDAMNELFYFLLLQYSYNNDNSERFDNLEELKLYRVYWDWTDTEPENVTSTEKLLYSTKTGLVQ